MSAPYLQVGDRIYTGEEALELRRLLHEAITRLESWSESQWLWDLTHHIWEDFYGRP